jgi:hypothetical protein
MDVECSFE